VYLAPSRSSPSTLEIEDPEAVGTDQAPARDEDILGQDHVKSSRHKWAWTAALISGVLSLIVVPGLVVGVMTRQMSWGIEFSGAIAPIVIFLAGISYHRNK
jgi:archaellum biogenesis protein FlaJ (TadC family)